MQGLTDGFLKNFSGAVISLVLLVAESFILKLKFDVTGMDIGIFVVPFTYFFIMTALNIDLKENKLWIWCRKLSMGIFLAQRVFLSSLPTVFPDACEVVYETNSYLGLVIVIAATILLSVLLILGGKKIKFLNYFM